MQLEDLMGLISNEFSMVVYAPPEEGFPYLSAIRVSGQDNLMLTLTCHGKSGPG
jgi:hypothetical protein